MKTANSIILGVKITVTVLAVTAIGFFVINSRDNQNALDNEITYLKSLSILDNHNATFTQGSTTELFSSRSTFPTMKIKTSETIESLHGQITKTLEQHGYTVSQESINRGFRNISVSSIGADAKNSEHMLDISYFLEEDFECSGLDTKDDKCPEEVYIEAKLKDANADLVIIIMDN